MIVNINTLPPFSLRANAMSRELGIFEKYLSAWVALCMIAGTTLGYVSPDTAILLSRLSIANVNIPIAVLLWFMIYPMMVKVDFSALKKLKRDLAKGLIITWTTNWLIKPFTMYLISYFFLIMVFGNTFKLINLNLATQYLAGAILLGAAPCTAMVFVWSYLSDGDPLYTLIQVATNDLIILAAYAPIVGFLMGISNIPVPYDTLILSVIMFVVIPLTAGYATRRYLISTKGVEWFNEQFIPYLNKTAIIGLLLTLILLFMYQGRIIVEYPVHILLIAVPLTIQTYLIFAIAYSWGWLWKLKHRLASPAALIGASNFFELAVAVAIALFGLKSGAVLATVVGVLEEVPVMLSLVYISNKTRKYFTG